MPRLAVFTALALVATPLRAQTTTLVTLSTTGAAADGECLYPELTPDGRFLVFQSSATTLVPGDTNGAKDIFVRDLRFATTTRVSVSDAGAQAGGDSLDPDVSADGRFVAFFSYAEDLVTGDGNGRPDVFVRDVVLGTTQCVSVDPAGAPCGGRYPSISADGRFVAFASPSNALVPGDTNGERDVFVRDLVLGTTVRASVDSSGAEGDGDSRDPALSADGRWVAFESLAANLVAGDTNGVLDVFVHDLVSGATVRASVGPGGVEGDGDSEDATLSEHGELVAFASDATNFAPGDVNGADDVFVHDLVSGVTALVSTGLGGAPADGESYDPTLSPDGRNVVFYADATNLVPGDTNGVDDIFLADLAAGFVERVSVGASGGEGDGACLYSDVSADGRFVVFDSLATNLAAGDVNSQRDVFLRDRAAPFASECAGDGTLPTTCPCGNTGAGGRGCANSSGSGGARLEAAAGATPGETRLVAWGLGPNALAIFLQSDARVPGGFAFGDGVRCVDGHLVRLFAKNANLGTVSAPSASEPSIPARSAARGDVLAPGATRHYQLYYRDVNTSFCPGATFNVSNGVRVTW